MHAILERVGTCSRGGAHYAVADRDRSDGEGHTYGTVFKGRGWRCAANLCAWRSFACLSNVDGSVNVEVFCLF